ncbi:MAG: alpha/beta fold hydrolase [Chloroflexi bacterium]|nr:alpha/beta fold hydrolase [Chloroflexota bacterium]
MTGNTYPIVLAHGIARFDVLTEALLENFDLRSWARKYGEDRLHYFKRIAPYLRAHGFEVHTTGVSFAADLVERARDLRQEIMGVLALSGHDKAHIIGHSMGGLDARAMIVYEGMADKTASATSIGSPHLGTTFADWGLAHGGHEIVETVGRTLDLAGFKNLTPDAMAAFNERARNTEATNDVVYQTYAAAQAYELVFGPLQEPWKIINEREGENDGLVSLKSQRWTTELVSDEGVVKRIRQFDFPIPADHLNQVGWWDVRELRQERWREAGIFRQKEQFETAVKNAYLQIANGLSSL